MNLVKIYTIEPLNCQIVFCCIKNFSKIKENIKLIDKKYRKEVLECDDNQDGMVLSNDNTNEPYLFYIKDMKKDWYFWEVLNHEINHLVFYLSRYYGFVDETEFQATLQESLFRNFRKIIQNK